MHNKVVFRAASALNDAGLVTLRINFRGVGASTGEHGGARGGEQEDARIALDYLIDKYPNLPVVIAGFSFGSRVGLEVGTHDARVEHLIGIGTPVTLKEREYDFGFVRDCRKPVLLVHGEKDEYGTVDDLLALAKEFPDQANIRVEIIPGAGHFFDDQLDELKQVIREWIDEQLSERRR
jgi:alpha/beta superfamily hydrolase